MCCGQGELGTGWGLSQSRGGAQGGAWRGLDRQAPAAERVIPGFRVSLGRPELGLSKQGRPSGSREEASVLESRPAECRVSEPHRRQFLKCQSPRASPGRV